MDKNARNQLLEFLRDLGYSETCADFKSESASPSGAHFSTVVVSFPDNRKVCGTGKGRRRSDADIAAAQDALNLLRNNYPDLFVNWDEIQAEAQAGDALIKLGAYLSTDLNSADEKSRFLQKLESDSHLAKVFDLWKSQDDPDLATWGINLSEKRKATLVEALLWKRFGTQVVAPDAILQLPLLLKMLVLEDV